MKNVYSFLIALLLMATISGKAQNFDNYINKSDQNEIKVVGDQSDGLTNPVDLDFNASTNQKYELWVLNQGTPNSGGSTVTFSDAMDPDTKSEYLQDGNAWHFMAMSTALTFGDNGNFATAQGIKDANRNGGAFTGPSLWSSDSTIYAKVGSNPGQGPNGSHLDMLHKSPFGMGLAHEKDNVYWVFDGHNENICRYNFAEPHPAGGEDHSDGIIKRYTEISVERDGNVPSHMVLDQESDWLYINDIGNQRILRLDITSGEKGNNLQPRYREGLGADYHGMQNTNWEVYIDQNLQAPSGIDVYKDRLVVTDNATNEIVIFDISGDEPKEMGRLQPDQQEITNIMGIKTGPYGRIFFVDHDQGKVYRLDNEEVIALGIEEEVENKDLNLYPNPSNSKVNISDQALNGDYQIEVYNNTGQEVYNSNLNLSNSKSIDLSGLNKGFYFVKISNDKSTHTGKVLID